MKRRLNSLENSFDHVRELIDASPQIAQSAPSLLKFLGVSLGCDWGTFWQVDAKAQVLRPAATWTRPGVEARKLEQDTRHRALSLSEGVAGHVWRSRKPVWTVDLITDMCLPRSLDAEDIGLHGGVWFAVKTPRTVYGVMEFLGSALPPSSEELLLVIEDLGLRLGNEIDRHLTSERDSTR